MNPNNCERCCEWPWSEEDENDRRLCRICFIKELEEQIEDSMKEDWKDEQKEKRIA